MGKVPFLRAQNTLSGDTSRILLHGLCGFGCEYRVVHLSSPRLSEDELREEVLKVLPAYNIKGEFKQISYVSKKGVRSKGMGLQCDLLEGKHYILFKYYIQKAIPAVEFQEYTYNDRFDSEELKEPVIDSGGIPKWLQPILIITFEHMKKRFLKGEYPRGTITLARELVKAATEWGPRATEEVIALLFSTVYHWEGSDYVKLQVKLRKLGIPEIDLRMSRFIGDAYWLFKHKHHLPRRKADIIDINRWMALVKAFLGKKWHKRLDCFSEIGRCCHLPRGSSGGYSGKDVFWVLRPPIRDRILRYATAPEITLDEFLDLAALAPPRGYTVHRLLSNTTGFKVVYRAQDKDGNFVALKRYQDWHTKRIQQILAKLKLTEKKVIKKDSLTHWMGDIRHTHILPCTVVKNKRGMPFIIEPLLEETLEKATTRKPLEVLRLFRQVCEAVKYLHSRGWIHSDIKPDNIGVQKGDAVLIDFGIASSNSPFRRPRENPGSIKTRAPELFLKSAVPTFESDVWALGATLMALVSHGEYPFIRQKEVKQLAQAGARGRTGITETLLERIKEYKNNPLRLEERIIRAVDKEFLAVCQLVLRACAFDPSDRPKAEELVGLIDKTINDVAGK